MEFYGWKHNVMYKATLIKLVKGILCLTNSFVHFINFGHIYNQNTCIFRSKALKQSFQCQSLPPRKVVLKHSVEFLFVPLQFLKQGQKFKFWLIILYLQTVCWIWIPPLKTKQLVIHLSLSIERFQLASY